MTVYFLAYTNALRCKFQHQLAVTEYLVTSTCEGVE